MIDGASINKAYNAAANVNANTIKRAKAHKITQVSVNGEPVATLQACTAPAYSAYVTKTDKTDQHTMHKLNLAAFMKVIELSEAMADADKLEVTLVIEPVN